MLKGIYAISDTLLTPKDKLEQSLQAAIQGGIALFQLRDKESCDERNSRTLSQIGENLQGF